MFDLNMGLAGAPLLGVDGSGVCTTPRTPEILNSLIDITNPLEYSYSSARPSQVSNVDSCCSDSTLDSPAGQTTPPSVQKTCSLLIKAGLKLSIQSKRKMSGGSAGDSNSGMEHGGKMAKKEENTSDEDTEEKSMGKNGQLTPEDEDRRRRRRERNKIAATKCRMKKRERTLNLVSESEVLEQQNIELKTQERALETQRRKLLEALQSHSSSCIRPGGYSPPSSCYQQSQCKFGSNCRMIKNDGQSQGLEIDTTHTYACKSATSDSNTTCYSSPESGCNALKSPVDLDLVTYNSPGMKNEYIPNCESGEEAVLGCSQFMLKTELTDSSPYTSVQSADRFLFENTENFDADRVPDIIRGDNNNDYTGSCGTFVENTLLKADFLSATSEFINLADGTETQFTDLDSGITTYTTLPPNSTGGGC
ncbi:activating transcription factor 3 isoform X2 [Phlebotomus papatasi]|uniref:activating transcription factor 3 isoform X2 n=1 Tax=Phlebotomus papatasi TaxID=29031 RepID=UPI0024840A70|nr:activating transcription factor 3 isoform X2 [Phlebotomus papatasi]